MNEDMEVSREAFQEGNKLNIGKLAGLTAKAEEMKVVNMENQKNFPQIKEDANKIFGEGFLLKAEKSATVEGLGSTATEAMMQKVKTAKDVVTFVRYISERPNRKEFDFLNIYLCLGSLKQKGGPKLPKKTDSKAIKDTYFNYESSLYKEGINIVKKIKANERYAEIDMKVKNFIGPDAKNGGASYVEGFRNVLEQKELTVNK